MNEIIRVHIPTRELLFSIYNETELPVLNGIKLCQISAPDTYISVSSYHKNEILRRIHLYINGQNIISVEEDGSDSHVIVAKSMEVIMESLLSLTSQTSIENESLDIPANFFIGLLASITKDEVTDFIKAYTDVSNEFATQLIVDIYTAIMQEHYVAYNSKNSVISFVNFIKGSNGLWRILPSKIEGNITIKSISTNIYKATVANFLKEMVK